MVKVKPVVLKEDGTLDVHKSMLAIAAHGKSGEGAGFGFLRFGASHFGELSHGGGILQRRWTGYNHTGKIPGKKREAYFVRMRPYRPANPRTEKQQAWRDVFSAACQAWNDLTPVEKSYYNSRGKRVGKVGRSLFISWYLKNNK